MTGLTPQSFVGLLASYILDPLLYLLFAAAMIVFLFGIVEFLWEFGSASSDGKSFPGREKGKKHILAGLIGLFIMLTAFSIIGFVLHTFNIPWPPGSSTTTSTTNCVGIDSNGNCQTF